MKRIQIILSKEAFKELQEIKKKLDIKPETYEQYLAREKKNPTHCLFG